jgi:hypothetical protein
MEKIREYFSVQGRKKMFYLLAILVAFVVLDGIITEYLIAADKAWEANAFLAPLIGGVGFMLLKIFGGLFCALVLWDVYSRQRKLALAITWIAVVGYGVIVLWNTSLIFIV